MKFDNTLLNNGNLKTGNSFIKREAIILDRIKTHYSSKLNRAINDNEAKEIAGNLLNFAKAIYGT